MIVSASRRCDLPAYRMGWLMSRIREGFCEARNPFDQGSLRRVSLLPEDLDCLVLWTRDPRPLLRQLDELEARGIRFYLQLSLTGYPAALEPQAPRPEEVFPVLRALAERIGPRRLVWRYDPIFFAPSENPAQPSLDRDYHLRNFEALSAEVEGSSSRLVLSLLDEYRYTSARLARAGYARPSYGSPRRPAPAASAPTAGQAELEFADPPGGELGAGSAPSEPARPAGGLEAYAGLLAELAACARSRGLEPRSCAEPELLAASGIESGACIDPALIEELFGLELGRGRDRGQRPGCRCAPSVDIGDYSRCPTGCAYCYARR